MFRVYIHIYIYRLKCFVSHPPTDQSFEQPFRCLIDRLGNTASKESGWYSFHINSDFHSSELVYNMKGHSIDTYQQQDTMIHVLEKILEHRHPLLAVQELGESFLESLPAQENYCPLSNFGQRKQVHVRARNSWFVFLLSGWQSNLIGPEGSFGQFWGGPHCLN